MVYNKFMINPIDSKGTLLIFEACSAIAVLYFFAGAQFDLRPNYLFIWIKKLIKSLFRGKEKKMAKKQAIALTLRKDGMETVLHIKAAKEIEDFFNRASRASKRSAPEIEVSKKWLDKNEGGLEFYKKNEKLSNKVSQFGPVMDNFGNGLMDESGRINLALLRIVGVSEDDGVTIKTEDLLGFQEMKSYIEKLAEWTKAFYEENLRDQELSATITFEL
jgi:hypothetical protein